MFRTDIQDLLSGQTFKTTTTQETFLSDKTQKSLHDVNYKHKGRFEMTFKMTFRKDFQDRPSGWTFRLDFQEGLLGKTFRKDFQDGLSG